MAMVNNIHIIRQRLHRAACGITDPRRIQAMNIFTYGSLMFPEVWRRVTGGQEPGSPAKLPGYEPRALRGQIYPALVENPDFVTDGILYENVEPEAVAKLDHFEGNFYIRREVTVLAGGDVEKQAGVYISALAGHPDILPEQWNAEEFAKWHLDGFLADDPGFNGVREL